MRSEFVYCAWALVAIGFAWKIQNPPENPYAYVAETSASSGIRDTGIGSDISDRPVGVIGDEDRVEFSTFQPVDFPWSNLSHQDYRASAIFDCDYSNGSASIVYRPDIVMFAAHQILTGDGELEKAAKSCGIIVGGRDGERYEIDWSTLKTGDFKIPKGRDDFFEWRVTETDWAIAKLVRPALDVTPYSLPPFEGTTVLPGSSIANVTSSTDSWPDPNFQGMLAQTCSYSGGIRRAPIDKVARYDCDTGRGASGSGLLAHDAGGNIYIFGILTDMNTGKQPCEKVGKFDCFTAGPRITRNIADIIYTMAAEDIAMLTMPADTKPIKINQPTVVLDLNNAKH